MIKNKLEEAFRVLAQAECAMPQPAGGWSAAHDGLTFREELADAVRRLNKRNPVAANPPSDDPLNWM